MAKKYYIGLACTYHDPAIAILDAEGRIIFAEASERSIQSKRSHGLVCDELNNVRSLIQAYCPDGDEFIISYSWSKTYLRKLMFQSYFGILDLKSKALDVILKDIPPNVLTSDEIVGAYRLQLGSVYQAGRSFNLALKTKRPYCKIQNVYYPHHLTHAAYACFTSPFEQGTCVVIDGFGERGSLSVFNYTNNIISTVATTKSLGSMGFFYGLITRFCGFDPIQGEAWKVMGLASYGSLQQKYYQLLRSMVEVRGMSFRYTLLRRWLNALKALSGELLKGKMPFQKAADMAFTGQVVFSEIVETLLNNIYKQFPKENLIYTGGCALNSTFNGQILKRTNFKRLYVPPAPGDDGNAIGAALSHFTRTTSGEPLFIGTIPHSSDQRYVAIASRPCCVIAGFQK